MNRYSPTTKLLLSALFAALTAACSFLSVPLPFSPVPINLATLSVFLAGGLLGFKYGSLSQLVYLILGAAGIPVFHNFTSGIGVLAGPTGGYIVGYVVAAFLIGLILHFFYEKHSPAVLVLSMLSGLAACYGLGTIWFMISTGSALIPALVACVIPFLIGDALKIAAAYILIRKLRPILT